MTRNYYFDNIKVYLIFLVVFGHLIEPLIINDFYRDIYLIIYSFHMPIFILVTGYFAKANPKGLKKLAKIFIKYEMIYAVVAICLFLIFRPPLNLSNGGFKPLLILEPIWLLWYLISLLWWRLILIMIEKSKLVLIVLIILIIGFNFIDFNFRILSIGRTLTFAPFFFVGYYLKKYQVNIIELKKYRKFIIVFTVLLAIFWSNNIQQIQIEDLYGARSLAVSYQPMLIVKLKLQLYLLATYTGLLFMIFVSDKEQSYSYLGAQTLPIYIYHGLIIMIMQFSGIFQYLQSIPQMVSLSVIILLSLFMVKYFAKLRV